MIEGRGVFIFEKWRRNCLIYLGHMIEGGIRVAGISAIGGKLVKKNNRMLKQAGVCRIEL